MEDSDFLFPIFMLSSYISVSIWTARLLYRGKGIQMAFWFLMAISPLELGMACTVLIIPFFHVPPWVWVTTFLLNIPPVAAYANAIIAHRSCNKQDEENAKVTVAK